MIFTISARGKKLRQPIFDYLARNYANIPIAQIDSVFGFVEKSTLYGGRHFIRPELSDQDICQLYDVGIGLRIPFSNHYVEREEYENNRLFLQKYHRKGNSIIAHRDELVEWIRQDFPEYQIEASVIKKY
ncbi:MAG: hypothetical protein OQK32_02180 [Gammaproteobacteria bacterium]|nr:hypothetical protein [Gammaproteobacteria bacterium]MCW8922816.1 hypothetical protein [Gammaproteobacteria bacterium]